MDKRFEITESIEHGVILSIHDIELADEFDDFVNEECYVFSDIKFESNNVHFYFGQASSIEKVGLLVKSFVQKTTNEFLSGGG